MSGSSAPFVWRFFDLGERRLALTSPFRRQAQIRPAAELARAFHALAPEPPYARRGGSESQPPPGGLALFEDACALGGVLIATGGALVAESLAPGCAPRSGSVRRERSGDLSIRVWPLTSMRRLAGDFIFLRQPGDDEYARWLIEVLPRVAVAAQFCDLSAFNFVVARQKGEMAQAVRDSLGLFGVRPERIVAIGDRPTFFQRLVFPLPVARFPFAKSPHAMEVLEYLPARFPAASNTPTRLFVKGGGLSAEDEAALVGLLSPLGFAAVAPRRLSFAECAQIFSRVERIVGAPGPGLANAAFAPRGLRLLALTAPGEEEDFFRDLADVKQGQFFSAPVERNMAAVRALLQDFLA